MEFAETREAAREAAGEEDVEDDDAEGEEQADEALGEDVEGAGGGEAVAVEAEAVVKKPRSQGRDLGHPGLGVWDCGWAESSSVRQKQ